MFSSYKCRIKCRSTFNWAAWSLSYQALEVRCFLSGNGTVGPEFAWNVLSEESEFDGLGRLVHQEISYDTDDDQIADLRETDRYVYGANGLDVFQTHEVDLAADGIVDSRYTNDQIYSTEGLMASLQEQWDEQADGQVDYRSKWSYTYNGEGALIHALNEIDLDGDGTFDEYYEEHYEPGDPNGGAIVDIDEEFDDLGRLIRATYSYHHDEDSIADSREVFSFTYRFEDLIDTVTQEVDHEADGIIDYRSISTYEYDGDWAAIAIHFQVDENGDGEFDSSYTQSLTEVSVLAGEARNQDFGSGGIDDSTASLAATGSMIAGQIHTGYVWSSRSSRDFATCAHAATMPVNEGELVLAASLRLAQSEEPLRIVNDKLPAGRVASISIDLETTIKSEVTSAIKPALGNTFSD